MTSYERSDYGSSNPNAGYPANGDFDAWGGYCYPGGVPSSLLGSSGYLNDGNGQTMSVSMREEIVELWDLAFEIIDRKHGYTVWAQSGGEAWGPWGYENRSISGSNNPSGHSAALSVDINAPYNPYSYTFESDMPPAMVADLESLGLYWGGRYVDQKYDPMHFGFCRSPSSVAGYITKARQILGTDTGDDDMPLNDDDLGKIQGIVTTVVHGEIQAVMTALYNVSDETTDPEVTQTNIVGMLQRAVTLGGHSTAQTTQAQITKAVKAAG